MLTAEQKKAIDEILQSLVAAKGARNRSLSEAFLELPDRTAWQSYYEVISKPRALHDIQENLHRGGAYTQPFAVYEDIALVFNNALYFNEEDSTIYKDAVTLKTMFERAWAKDEVLTKSNGLEKLPRAPSKQPGDHAGSASDVVQALHIEDTLSNLAVENNWESLQPRDKQGDELIKKIDRSLPRWKGPGLEGWLNIDVKTQDPYQRYVEILEALKIQKDRDTGTRLADSLDRISESAVLPDLYFQSPISLGLIESRIELRGYPGPKDFDMDLYRLFEKGRRWFEEGSREYGQVLVLQRLYQGLTTMPAGGSLATSITSNFSSIVAGPGNAKPLHSAASTSDDGVTTYRIQNKEREFIDEITFKGITYRTGDYVHLMNPDDPARPIIGQIFKVYIPDSAGPGQRSLTACWYFRPEQTHHPAQRTFWDREVFKTGHFADHTMEDIIEKIACQFMTKHIRGRPKAPFWFPGWPLYVCDSRYNDRDRTFVRIKNWNSCIPDELRKSDFMPIVLFERTVMPKKRGSPFLRGLTGPGGLGEDTEGKRKSKRATALAARTTVPISSASVDKVAPIATPSTGHLIPGAAPGALNTSKLPQVMADRSLVSAAGGPAALGGNPVVEVLPPDTTQQFDCDPVTKELLWFTGPPINAPAPAVFHPRYSLEYLAFLERTRSSRRKVDLDELTHVAELDGTQAGGGKRARH